MEIHGENPIDAWKTACATILNNGDQTNFSVTIESPLASAHADYTARSPHAIAANADNVFSVANTIFPAALAASSASKEELYAKYGALMKRMRRRPGGFKTWGTYFERLTAFGSTRTNQLDRAIGKLNTWTVVSKTGLVFHLSSPETDTPRTRGAPCWHFGELLCHPNGTIDLMAVYRNQDYFNKALGNYLGLANLLNFICQQSGRNPGKLICNAAHAFNGGTKASLTSLTAI